MHQACGAFAARHASGRFRETAPLRGRLREIWHQWAAGHGGAAGDAEQTEEQTYKESDDHYDWRDGQREGGNTTAATSARAALEVTISRPALQTITLSSSQSVAATAARPEVDCAI